jgi:hypothetical protein
MEFIGKLHVKKNGAIVNSFTLELGENIIGRPSKEKPSTIEIKGNGKLRDDGKLSRQHFIINVNQNEDGTLKFLLRDNNSLNGTQVMSGKKRKTLSANENFQLLHKDVIKAGEKFLFELEIPNSECEEPTGKMPKSVYGKISVPITNKEGKTVHEMISCEQILGIKADGNYAYLYLSAGQKLWANKNLKYFEDLLKEESYMFRIHDKYIVNLNIIKSYNIEGKDGRIVLLDNIKIDDKNVFVVSRTYKELFESNFIKK